MHRELISGAAASTDLGSSAGSSAGLVSSVRAIGLADVVRAKASKRARRKCMMAMCGLNMLDPGGCMMGTESLVSVVREVKRRSGC